MKFDIRSYLRSLLALVGFLVAGCENSVSPAPSSPTPAAVHVTVVTTGAPQNLDADGYALRMDSGPYQHLETNDTASIRGVAAGTHMVRLDGVALNCFVEGTNPRRVDVESGAASYNVQFTVTCLGTTGSVRISTVTTGESPDADGYWVQLGDLGTFQLPSNGTRTITGVRLGTVGATLNDVAGNCAVDNPRNPVAQVVNDSTANFAFVIRCVAAGTLRIITTTRGIDPDQNGYVFYFQRQGEGPSDPFLMPIDGEMDIPALLPGTYLLYPIDIAANCDPAVPTPRSISVAAGDPTPVVVEIDCAAATPLAFVTSTNGSSTIQKMNSNGTERAQLTSSPGTDQNPAWSPDGTRIAFASSREGGFDIFVMGPNGENPVRLTTSTAAEYAPAWSPDGRRIAFTSQLLGENAVYVINADGSNQLPLTNGGLDADPAWSPDGGKIAFSRSQGGIASIWVVNADGSDAHQLTSGSTSDTEPAWSPDGARIAFSSGRSDQSIVVIDADGSNRTQITPGLLMAVNAAWSPDGKKIAFTSFQSCGWYDYYSNCGRFIKIIGLDGTQYTGIVDGGAEYSEPSWRR